MGTLLLDGDRSQSSSSSSCPWMKFNFTSPTAGNFSVWGGGWKRVLKKKMMMMMIMGELYENYT